MRLGGAEKLRVEQSAGRTTGKLRLGSINQPALLQLCAVHLIPSDNTKRKHGCHECLLLSVLFIAVLHLRFSTSTVYTFCPAANGPTNNSSIYPTTVKSTKQKVVERSWHPRNRHMLRRQLSSPRARRWPSGGCAPGPCPGSHSCPCNQRQHSHTSASSSPCMDACNRHRCRPGPLRSREAC